jgi:VCBS repeat-containing protein
MQSFVTKLLTDQATIEPGAGYTLVGKIATILTNSTTSDATKGIVTLTIKAEGVWVFQFSNIQRQQLAKLITGKSKQTTTDILLNQVGVARVDLQLPNGSNTFPTIPDQIRIVVRDVPGLVGTPT